MPPRKNPVDAGQPKKTLNRTMKNAKDDAFYSSPYSVADRVSLNYFDPDDNSNKFYIAEVHVSEAGLGFRFYANHGRVGSNGAPKAEAFLTLSEAVLKYQTKVREKLRKGYNKVDLATVTAGSGQGQKKINEDGLKGVVDTSAISKKSSDLPVKVADFVKHIYDEANQAVSLSLTGSVKTDIKAPLGNLGINGINAGRKMLAVIARAVKSGDSHFIRQVSIEYYRNIPRKLPTDVRDENTWLLNTHERISREMDILDLYEDSLRLLPIMGLSDIDSKYAALNTDILPVTDKETMDYILHKIASTHASNHSFRLKVVNAFEVRIKNAPLLYDGCGNIVRLFHGSRSANLVGILSSHLKMPSNLGSDIIKTGAMFGQGIYFASECTKSANYSFGSWAGRPNKYKTAFLMLCEVALGNVYKVSSWQHLTKAPVNHHSVMGQKGPNLHNNEFIIYRPDQVRVRYLVEVEKV